MGRKVPPQLIHDFEGFPHVGRIDGYPPLVLLFILRLRCGLRARLGAVNRKREGKSDRTLVGPVVRLCPAPMGLVRRHLSQPDLLTQGSAVGGRAAACLYDLLLHGTFLLREPGSSSGSSTQYCDFVTGLYPPPNLPSLPQKRSHVSTNTHCTGMLVHLAFSGSQYVTDTVFQLLGNMMVNRAPGPLISKFRVQ